MDIATGIMTKMQCNKETALFVLLRICEYLDCSISDICDTYFYKLYEKKSTTKER